MAINTENTADGEVKLKKATSVIGTTADNLAISIFKKSKTKVYILVTV